VTAAELLAHGVPRVWLWRRGVDIEGFHPARRDEAVRRVLAPGGEILVGYVGRLAVEKRVDLLAQAARLPGVRVVVIGDGPARSRVRRALPTAVFLGARHGQQLAKLYASLDIFVHTGPLETFGQAVQEALASGLPVVAPAAGGPLGLVEHGRTGYLVPPRDGAAIAAAVAQLVADADLRRRYGEAARASVLGRTWTTIGDELLDHYRAAVAGAVVAKEMVAEELVANELVANELVAGGNVAERATAGFAYRVHRKG
jgi:phosphatidylinositol alpha 1,6-mannosyltransferase